MKDFPEVCEKSEEIITNDIILPESLYANTRGFVERVAVQVNACYQYNIFDGCAMMMRRLMEILLILCYRHAGRIEEVKEDGGSVKKLVYLIDYAIRNKVIPLTKGTEDVLHEFRTLGNYSAHGIEYQCRKTEINKVKQAYRVCIEELLYGSGLKK